MTTMERRPDSRGKVRDIYDAGETLLMVATDRISAFDFILPDEIPFKGGAQPHLGILVRQVCRYRPQPPRLHRSADFPSLPVS